MERLTFEGNFCDIAQCSEVPGGSFCEDGACSQKKVWERLKAYEDTRLSPEDCAEYKKFEDEIIASGKTFGRLIELLDADKDGRVVLLPCKVGDKVWFETYKNSARDFIGIQPHEVARISVDIIVPGEIVDTGFPADQVGRTVFLTKEEAEKALAEMEGKA